MATCTPNQLAKLASCMSCVPQGQRRSAALALVDEWAGGITPPVPPVTCTDPDYVPVLSNAVYGTNGLGDTNVLINFSATVTCVCADGGEWVLYGSNNPDGSSATEVNTIPIVCAAGPCTETVPIPLPVPAYSYFYLTQRCADTTEYGASNILPLGDPVAAAAVTTAFEARVVTNGGAGIGSSTRTAITELVQSLMGTQLYDEFYILNAVVPDNLIAAQTPLIVGSGSSLWANTGFVAADLSVNGLAGDGATKYLNTGFNPVAPVSATNFGMSAYVPVPYEAISAASDASSIMGCWGTGRVTLSPIDYPTTYGLVPAASAGAPLACIDCTNGSYAFPSGVAGRYPGFFSANRSDANVRLYHGSNVFPCAQIVSTAVVGATGSLATNASTKILAWAADFSDGGALIPRMFSRSRASFIAAHRAFTTAQAQALYSAVHTYRVALGGGYSLLSPANAASSFESRVIVNGGTAISSGTKTAVQNFITALNAAGIHKKIWSAISICPDNLTAARTPIILHVGKDPWWNQGFIAGDLTASGLLQNAAKYLATPFRMNVDIASRNPKNFGLHYYVSGGDNGAGVDFGAWVGQNYKVVASNGGNAQITADAYSRSNASEASYTGFVSFNISGSNYGAYGGKSGTGFVTFGTHNAATPGNSADQANMFLGASNYAGPDNSGGYEVSGRKYSFAAVGESLNATEAQALYNAVQALRTALGGGYV